MSIKDLFNKKTTLFRNAESASVDVESISYMENKAAEAETFLPAIDFSSASNFVKFGSAKEYYLSSIERIYKNYPYDGSESEKLQFTLSSSYLDRWIFDNKYPKSTGYANLNASGYGNSNKTDGYGLNSNTAHYEYIFVGGGVHVRDIAQHDPTIPTDSVKLHKKFPQGNKYEVAKEREGVFEFDASNGFAFEWWMNKKAFDTSYTDREVILDMWNGEVSSSSEYGRITIEMDRTEANSFRFTYQSGSDGVFDVSLTDAWGESDIADGAWHHYAVSALPYLDGATAKLDVKFYKDGVVFKENTHITTAVLGTIPKRSNAYIGALLTSPSGSSASQYSGKLSASIDEVRFWKKRITSQEIYNNWYHPIGGGSNTDDYRKWLGLYYKFNEGITGTSSIDSIVLDYSGRVANGAWTGYSTTSRDTGSCFVQANKLTEETGDPIIRYVHSSVVNLVDEMTTSGSQFDVKNPSYMFDMAPAFARQRDEEQGDENLKKLYHIMASYFDTLHAQITALPDLKAKQYFLTENKPYPFVKDMLESAGLIAPNILIGSSVLEDFYDRDSENKKYSNTLDDLKTRIYYNIYNNLKTIYESKGTEKSYRNLLRCFGVDDEIIKLNLYTDNAISYLTDKTKYSSHKTKFLNSNTISNYAGRVFNTSSANNPNTFVPGNTKAKNLAFTLETDIIAPLKKTFEEDGYIPTDFLSSSIMGFHEANASTPSDFTWYGDDYANLQVHLVRRERESKDAKFVITNKQGTVFAQTEFFKEIYDNERWGLALKVYPDGYPFIGTVATSSNPTYTAELYGVNQILDEVKHEFRITASIDHTTGSAILCNAKRFYAGCEAINFTGTISKPNDIKIAACRLWWDKLDDVVIKQHNKDSSNYGHSKIHGNPTPYITDLLNKHVPSSEVLAFNWDFQLVTGSDSSGNFVVEDFSSGSAANKYGWIDDLISRECRAKGFGYETSSTDVVVNEFIFSAKKELPEISFTSDSIFIKGEEQELFGEDEDISDNIFAFEKSMYQVLSEEIFKTFSTVTEYANLFMKPVDRYRENYKRLDHFKQIYFSRVDGDLDFERFTNYYKFLDSTISTFIQQLHPAMAKFNEGISDMVESHILERPKYQRKFPFMTTRDPEPDGKIVGAGERLYNWRTGHAPNYRSSYDDNDNCLWQKQRAERTEIGGTKLNELKTVIVSEVDGKAKNLGTSDRVIYQGSTYAVRSFGRQYRLSYAEQKTIHGGINYGHQKHRDFILDHVRPHGPIGSNDVPQDVVVVGVGQGQGLLGLDKCEDFSDPYVTDNYSLAHRQKAEWNYTGIVGRYAGSSSYQPKSDTMEQLNQIKGHRGFFFNLVSGTINSGYNRKVYSGYEDDVIVTNLHSDTTTLTNEIPLQGPFTETWVGGRQFRHVPMNRYNPLLVSSGGVATIKNLDDQYTRPEGYRLLMGDHPSEVIKDGALGVVGPDYGGPYPDTSRKMAIHYRGDRIKRPINIGNINYTTASYLLGNYQNNYEVVHSIGKKENNLKFRQFADVSSSLPSNYGNVLPQTTNLLTFFGVVPYPTGAVFGLGSSNMIADDKRVSVPEIAGQFASGSFVVTGTAGVGVLASGSFTVSGAMVLSRPTGSFHVSSSYVPGNAASGSIELRFAPFSDGLHTFTTSTGSLTVPQATIFGLQSTGSMSFTMPTLSTSTGSVTVTGSTQFGARASGSFTAAGRSIFGTQYTGSFQLQGPPKAATRSYISFMVEGTTMTDADTLSLTFGGTTKSIETQTNAESTFSPRADILLNKNNTSSTLIKSIRSSANVMSTRFYGDLDNISGSHDLSVSFWCRPQDINTSTYFRLADGWATQTKLTFNASDIAIEVRNTANSPSTRTFNTNHDNSTGWIHLTLTLKLSNMSDVDPTLYINGEAFTGTETGTGSPGGVRPALDRVAVDLRGGDATDGVAIHDLIVWDKILTAAEAWELYANGQVYNPGSDHSANSNIVAHWKLGEESAFNLYAAGDDLTGFSSLAKTYGSATTSSLDNWGKPENMSIVNHTGSSVGSAKTNVQIWDQLKTDLNTAFSDCTTTYISGSSEAQFFVIKDTAGNNTVTQSETGNTFTLKASGSGQDAVASTLEHGDNITIEGETFTINTTTSGSALNLINAGNTFRKAVKGDGSSDRIQGSWDFDWNGGSGTYITFSFWTQYPDFGSFGHKALIDTGTFNTDNRIQLTWNGPKLNIQLNHGGGNDVFSGGTIWNDFIEDEWIHLVVAIPKVDVNGYKMWVNGEAVSLSGYSGTGLNTMGTPTNISVGNTYSSMNTVLKATTDLAIWNVELDDEDAAVLYNSGSWFDVRSHVSASHLNNYWFLGEALSESIGDELSGGEIITDQIGTSNLTVTNTPSVVAGPASSWKSNATIWNELETEIESETTYTAGQVNQESVSGNTVTFALSSSVGSAPATFTNNADQGFKNLVGPTANGITSDVVSGADPTSYLQIGPMLKIYPDPDGDQSTTSAPFYAQVGGNYYVYSSASSDSVWWGRLLSVCNVAFGSGSVNGRVVTNPSNGDYEITASDSGTASNATLAKDSDPSTFSNLVSVAGGTDDTGVGSRRIVLNQGGTYKYLYADQDVAALTSGYTQVVDGVKKANGLNNWYISSTGSVAGTSGVDADFWNRVTASIEDAIGGSPTFQVNDLGNNTARIEITGSYEFADTHDITIADSGVGSGNQFYVAAQQPMAGYGKPSATHISNDAITIDDMRWSLLYPWNNYKAGGISANAPGSRKALEWFGTTGNCSATTTFAELDEGVDHVSVSFWMKIDIDEDTQYVIKFDDNYENSCFIFYVTNEEFQIYRYPASGGSHRMSTYDISSYDETWVHVIAIVDKSDVSIQPTVYFNGGSAAIPGTPAGTASGALKVNIVKLEIGDTDSSTSGNETVGLLQDLTIWDGQLTDITGLYDSGSKRIQDHSQAALIHNHWLLGDEKEFTRAANQDTLNSLGVSTVTSVLGQKSTLTFNGTTSVRVSTSGKNCSPYTIPIRVTGAVSSFVTDLGASMNTSLINFSTSVTSPRIELTASVTGSANNINFTRTPAMASIAEHPAGGTNETGVGHNRGFHFRATGSTLGYIFSHHSLSTLTSGSILVDGVRKTIHDPPNYFVSSTGSTTDFLNRITASIQDATTGTITFGSYVSSGDNMIIPITGSEKLTTDHDLSFTASFHSYNPKTGIHIYQGSQALTGSGKPKLFNGTIDLGGADGWSWTIGQGSANPKTFELVFPYNNYAVSTGSNIAIRGTASYADPAYLLQNAISRSMTENLHSDYVIYGFSNLTFGGIKAQYDIRATNTGSSYNGDISVSTTPAIVISHQMQEGYDSHASLDDDWLFMGCSGSGNHLFKLDTDEAQPAIVAATHSFTVMVDNNDKFSMEGELVTGSVYGETMTPSIVLVRGSTYKFMNGHSSNSGHKISFYRNKDGTDVYTGTGTGISDHGVAGDGDGATRFEFQVPSNAPDRLYYTDTGKTFHTGSIYILSASNVHYVAATGSANQLWSNLSSSINAVLPNLNVSYSDGDLADQSESGTSTSDTYLPEVGNAIFRFTGSTSTNFSDETFIMASGSSWSNVLSVTGAAQRIAGVESGDYIKLNWGVNPYLPGNGSNLLLIGVDDPISGVGPNDDSTIRFSNPTATFSSVTNLSLSTVFTGSSDSGTAWENSSSLMWNSITQSIKDTNQYTVSMSVDGGGKYATFHVTSSYHSDRFNTSSVAYSGFSTSSANNSFNISTQITGGAASVGGVDYDQAELEFRLAGAQYVVRMDSDGWRNEDDPSLNEIYINTHHATSEAFWNEITSALTSSDLGNSWTFSWTETSSSPKMARFDITASYTGSSLNSSNMMASASATGLTVFSSLSEVTGGVTFAPTQYYDDRINVMPREQTTFDNGVRQKTIITSRFSAPGGPETSTDGWLDIYAKEYTPYNALPFRNKQVLGDSGEATSIRVNSHAARRDGLRTLSSRHTGRAGLDSTYGTASSSDYLEPSAGGTHEPAFYKVHRNTKVVPTEVIDDRAVYAFNNNFTSYATPTIGMNFSNKLSISFWFKNRIDNENTTFDVLEQKISSGGTSPAWKISCTMTGNTANFKFFAVSWADEEHESSVELTVSNPYDWNHIVFAIKGDSSGTPTASDDGTFEAWVNGTKQISSVDGTVETTGLGIFEPRALKRSGYPKDYFRFIRDVTSWSGKFHIGLDDDTNYEIHSLGIWRTVLDDSDVEDIYNGGNPQYNYSPHNSDLHVFWYLNDFAPNTALSMFDPGPQQSLGSSVTNAHLSRFNSGDGETRSGMAGIGSVHRVFTTTISRRELRNNFYYQTHLPASDYHYSWVTSSLGDNYSVRSGKQKVFGYWPKDGILSSSAGFDSAIVFPTGSEIFGS